MDGFSFMVKRTFAEPLVLNAAVVVGFIYFPNRHLGTNGQWEPLRVLP